MLKTILLLIFALIAVPLVSFWFDQPLSGTQLDALYTCLIVYGATALSCFVLSEITGNCSQVDKIWSIIPIAYVWIIAGYGGYGDRLILGAALVTIWGARLTYNFSRRGAYSLKFWAGEEDYRWGVLRKMPLLSGRFRWMMFNLFFISLYQNGLILLFSLPLLLAIQEGAPAPLSVLDYAAAIWMVFFLIAETVADQQQWNYQQEKYRRIRSGEKLTGIYAKGFVHTGLWKIIRHPNYMAEQAIWIGFYFFSVAATGRWINWSVTGCVLLMLLFQGSSDFSEGISASKYPDYLNYKKTTGRFLPKLF